MPNEIVKVVGTNLRRLRTLDGRSLSDLARASDVAKATLSALEGGRGNPTLETLSALAAALQVPMGDLITAADPEPVTVVRNDEGTDIPGTANDLRLIARFTPGGTVEVYEAQWPKRSTRNAGGHGPGTREHVFITRGGLRVGPLGREVGLAGGDYATFAADEPHIYEARAGTRALLLMQWAPGVQAAAERPAVEGT
ncbi:MAG: anaerobic benzoate catabolism transcriptional regulator [Conexibacter sp.]|jgi:transcriptional regulator with XRE-family HTH domain|nr:anaerobic benzoate catabolism transcriptional regulator [Conexibacter sp.]MCZ4495005.1 anaerobic benzoate catabolism transcriptional regulator [Conexibacter sp.]